VGQDVFALGVIWYICFIFSATCHEAAHALAAKWGGDLTAYEGGQVTLNPGPHMRREPFGMIIVPIVSFLWSGWMLGWASAPYDPRWRDRHPRRAAWMALAGPAANFILVILVGIVVRVLLSAGVLSPPSMISFVHIVSGPDPEVIYPLATALSILFSLNVLLGVFNLIPVPPLDGAAALGLVLSPQQSRKLNAFLSGGPMQILGIFIAWKVSGWVFGPAFRVALGLLYAG